MTRQSLRNSVLLVGILAAAVAVCAAQTGFDVYRFPKGGERGFGPYSSLVADAEGNLYGTTEYGGTGTCIGNLTTRVVGCGIIFRLTPPSAPGGEWTQTVLYNFQGGNDGQFPMGGVIFDAAGNLYGTTLQGGTSSGGTAFELSPGSDGRWMETVLFNFSLLINLFSPSGNLVFDGAGNLYGTTGATITQDDGCDGIGVCGGVFELSPPSQNSASWTETTIIEFTYQIKGAGPAGGLIFDKSGKLYGTTFSGGTFGIGQCSDYGCGTVFELSPPVTLGGNWTPTTLWAFQNLTADGIVPYAGLVADKNGNLFGTTQYGGAGTDDHCEGLSTDYGCGTIFELTPTASGWVETIIHNFESGTGGSLPVSALVFDDAGNLYGTTSVGGKGDCAFLGNAGCGTVFKLLAPSNNDSGWTLITLAEFSGGDGYYPAAQLLLSNGAIYGTTFSGGEKCWMSSGSVPQGCGTVFKIIP